MAESYFHKKLDKILGKEKDKSLKVPSRCRVIAATSRKGGTGKTITTVTLAAVYAEMGFRVLVIDLDDSGDGGDRIEWQYNISDVFENTVTIDNSIVATDIFGSSDGGCIHLIGSDLRNQIYASQHSSDNGKNFCFNMKLINYVIDLILFCWIVLQQWDFLILLLYLLPTISLPPSIQVRRI